MDLRDNYFIYVRVIDQKRPLNLDFVDFPSSSKKLSSLGYFLL